MAEPEIKLCEESHIYYIQNGKRGPGRPSANPSAPRLAQLGNTREVATNPQYSHQVVISAPLSKTFPNLLSRARNYKLLLITFQFTFAGIKIREKVLADRTLEVFFDARYLAYYYIESEFNVTLSVETLWKCFGQASTGHYLHFFKHRGETNFRSRVHIGGVSLSSVQEHLSIEPSPLAAKIDQGVIDDSAYMLKFWIENSSFKKFVSNKQQQKISISTAPNMPIKIAITNSDSPALNIPKNNNSVINTPMLHNASISIEVETSGIYEFVNDTDVSSKLWFLVHGILPLVLYVETENIEYSKTNPVRPPIDGDVTKRPSYVAYIARIVVPKCVN